MKIAKYQASTMREALALAKRELGENAIILSSREFRRGLRTSVEVTAAIDHDGPELPPDSPPPRATPGSLPEVALESLIAPLRMELRALRNLVKEASNDDRLRSEVSELRRTVNQLQQRPSLSPSVAEPVVRNRRMARAVALVGPTGVGKTTTIAKLAARAALVRREKVAILTLDDYRVGGEEQIKVFADLIGAPARMATTPDEINAAIDEFADCDRIFVDTAGRSPLDVKAFEALGCLLANIPQLEVHLVVPITASPGHIDTIYAKVRQVVAVDFLLFSKLDETMDLTELARAPKRLNLPMAWVTTGQAVPEDLHDASPASIDALLSKGLPELAECA